MKWLCSGILASLTLLPAGAGVIDISSQTTERLQSGDVLSFLISDGSFGLYAGNMGIASAPTYIGVDFASSPGNTVGEFTALLESSDGSASAPFLLPMEWQAGAFSGSLYQGPVSVLNGSISLPESLSREIFSDSTAVLLLSYTGPDEDIGLAPYTLQQDMTVSLYGGPLNVSAQKSGVALQRFGLQDAVDSTTAAPEPHSSTILLACGALFCMVAGLLKRFSKRNV